MLNIFVKEIRSFLSSLIAYIVIAVFLIGIGLFMWVFPETNLLDFGYANMDTLFYMAPYVFIFLISAITMRSFSEEKRNGTIEILTTKPLSDRDIILGKFLAGVALVLFSILPTLLYYYTVYQLGAVKGNLDTGAILGSYIGLFFLGSCYVAVGLFASAVTENQIVSFILSMFLCFMSYAAFQQISRLELFGNFGYRIEWLGIDYHYNSISRGVLDTRDVVYFFSFIALFLGLTQLSFGRRKWS
jgi:ABC-2 type transport system permease protein